MSELVPARKPVSFPVPVEEKKIEEELERKRIQEQVLEAWYFDPENISVVKNTESTFILPTDVREAVNKKNRPHVRMKLIAINEPEKRYDGPAVLEAVKPVLGTVGTESIVLFWSDAILDELEGKSKNIYRFGSRIPSLQNSLVYQHISTTSDFSEVDSFAHEVFRRCARNNTLDYIQTIVLNMGENGRGIEQTVAGLFLITRIMSEGGNAIMVVPPCIDRDQVSVVASLCRLFKDVTIQAIGQKTDLQLILAKDFVPTHTRYIRKKLISKQSLLPLATDEFVYKLLKWNSEFFVSFRRRVAERSRMEDIKTELLPPPPDKTIYSSIPVRVNTDLTTFQIDSKIFVWNSECLNTFMLPAVGFLAFLFPSGELISVMNNIYKGRSMIASMKSLRNKLGGYYALVYVSAQKFTEVRETFRIFVLAYWEKSYIFPDLDIETFRVESRKRAANRTIFGDKSLIVAPLQERATLNGSARPILVSNFKIPESNRTISGTLLTTTKRVEDLSDGRTFYLGCIENYYELCFDVTEILEGIVAERRKAASESKEYDPTRPVIEVYDPEVSVLSELHWDDFDVDQFAQTGSMAREALIRYVLVDNTEVIRFDLDDDDMQEYIDRKNLHTIRKTKRNIWANPVIRLTTNGIRRTFSLEKIANGDARQWLRFDDKPQTASRPLLRIQERPNNPPFVILVG